MFNWIPQNIELILTIAIIVAFIATVIGTMIYNPNYSVKEILKDPRKFFDLLDHS
jgi:capsular polysaccharide biosynthesis protein